MAESSTLLQCLGRSAIFPHLFGSFNGNLIEQLAFPFFFRISSLSEIFIIIRTASCSWSIWCWIWDVNLMIIYGSV